MEVYLPQQWGEKWAEAGGGGPHAYWWTQRAEMDGEKADI